MRLLEKNIKMSDGKLIPQIGLGTFKMTNEAEIVKSVKTALENGYRHIDTAQIYGNEVAIGIAIKETGIPREDIFITSKVWNREHSYDKALAQVDEILKRLDIPYLDLCLVHWPTEQRAECYKALEAAHKAGKIRSIGVSNYEVHHLEELLATCKVKPVVNQIEVHPGFNNLKVVEYCQKNNIIIESWATMMQGKCGEVEEIVEMAKKYNKNPGQICLRWAIQLGYVIIPKSVHPNRIIENVELDDFELTHQEMKVLADLPQHRLGGDPNNVNF